MGQFFGSFYCMLEDLFGLDLANYMWGLVSPYATSNLFIPIGLTMFIISLVFMLVYYYVLDHPKLCSLWGWLLFLTINLVINVVVGWQWVQMHLYEGRMVFINNKDHQEIPLPVDEWNCFLFGVANGLLSILTFVAFSYMFKWKSTNCWVAPENTFRR
jgi:hypothetical protein